MTTNPRLSHDANVAQRDGVHVHHRRDGDSVAVTVVSGEALRERLARFERFVSACSGFIVANRVEGRF